MRKRTVIPYKKRVIQWAVIGFAVPIFWGVMSFIWFNAKESVWTTVYWYLVYVTCPSWLLDIPSILTPVLNAALYGSLAFVILNVSRKPALD
jgi:hypothetical protein